METAQNNIVGTVIPGNIKIREFIRCAIYGLMRLLLRVKVTGQENIPKTGPAVMIINHISFFDPIFVICVLPQIIIPMAKIEAFNFPVFAWIMKNGGTIPVHRGEADMNAVKLALQVLKHNGIILLAPEGTRSPTHQMQPAKDGATMLALRGKAPIVPVGVTGSHQIMACFRRFKRSPVNISIGKPFYLQVKSGGRRPSREKVAALTEHSMRQVAALLPLEYQGVYGTLLDNNTGNQI